MERERAARGLEREEKVSRRSQVCQDMSRQPAAELRSYGRQLRRISASFSPLLPPGAAGGGEVTSRLRLAPGSRALEGVLRLQSASQPVVAAGDQAAARSPAAVISLVADVPTRKCPTLSSPPSPGAPPSAGYLALSTGSARQGSPPPPLRLPPGLPNPVGQRFPRLGLQVMLFPFCS